MTRSVKLGAVIIVLLVFVAIINHAGDERADAKDKSDSPKLHSLVNAGEEPDTTHSGDAGAVTLPDPIGPEDAAINIMVYVTSDNTCDTTTLGAMEDMGNKYKDRIRVEFADMLDEAVLQEAQNAKLGCKSGLTINGKSQFLLPERGIKGTVLLDGPPGEKNYTMDDVEAVIQHLLKEDEDAPADDAAKAVQDEPETEASDAELDA